MTDEEKMHHILEPLAASVMLRDGSVQVALLRLREHAPVLSIAISLKRIADKMDAFVTKVDAVKTE
jgi:hypothetical protein